MKAESLTCKLFYWMSWSRRANQCARRIHIRRKYFMKNSLLVLAVSLAFAPLALAAEVQLKDQKDKISYSIGLDIGTTLKRQVIEVNEELLNTGIQDGLSGKKPLLSEDQVKETMALFQKEMLAKQAEAKKAAAAKNSAEATKFLAENKTKEGVKTTASGLQYKVLKEGSGPTPKPTDTVKVNYRGTVLDGTEFDSSYKRGEPASFPVNRVIKGWTEALQLMKVGSKYQLFIPADLAYGGRGAGSDIGPNAMLIFDVELLGINPPTPTPPKPVALPKAADASASPSPKPGASASLSPSASPKAAGPASPKPSPSP
jgi:FKBP-type peptidyl-prolyl cis-trans isomerase